MKEGGKRIGRRVGVIFGILAVLVFIFFFNDTATTEIYTLSLHDALPIYVVFAVLLIHLQIKKLPLIKWQFEIQLK